MLPSPRPRSSPRYAILEPSVAAGGPAARGAKGRNLELFLSTFAGAGAVRRLATGRIRELRGAALDTLFVGVPTDLGPEDFAGLRPRRIALFDYDDLDGPKWGSSDRSFLSSLTDLYLKAWVDPGWDAGFRFGVLPIRRHRRLELAILARELVRRTSARVLEPAVDVVFVGKGTFGGARAQRVEWLREILAARDGPSFWGGLVGDAEHRAALEEQLGNTSALFLDRRRVTFPEYFARLCRARVALAPAGNARWSYRLWEALYAGAMVVAPDFRHTRMLLPLPEEGVVQVPDGAPVLPSIDAALEQRRRDPACVPRAVARLEQELERGSWSRAKPAPFERFVAQLR